MNNKYEKLKFIALIITILIIITIVCQMKNIQEAYANHKCLENGYKIAFNDKINSSGLLPTNDLISSYDNIQDGRLTPLTMNNETKSILNYILGNILNQINKKTNSKFYLQKIDSVNINKITQGSISDLQVDREINKRITVDFFTHELNKLETYRFITIFTIDNLRNVKVEHINLSNAFKTDYGKKGCINTKISADDLIHTDKALYTNNMDICGIDESKLSYTNLSKSEKLTNKNKGYVNPLEFGKLIFLPSVLHDTKLLDSQGLFPNRKHIGWWDTNGVALVEDNNCNFDKNNVKIGLDHGINNRDYQPYDNPTVARYNNKYDNKYTKLFSRTEGNYTNGNVAL